MHLPLDVAFSAGRAVRHGIEMLKRQPIGLLLGAMLLALTEGGGGSGGNFSGGGGGSGEWDSSGSSDPVQQIFGSLDEAAVVMMVLVVGGCALCMQLGFWLFRSWLTPGYLGLHRSLVVSGEADIGGLFQGGAWFRDMLLWKLLKGVIGLGVACVALTPGIALAAAGYALDQNTALMAGGGGLAMLLVVPAALYVGLGLSLGEHAVVYETLSPMEALERTWNLARGNRVSLFIYFFIMGLFTFVGIFLCCVGVFATRAIADAGTSEAFLLATCDDWESWALIEELGIS